MALRKKERQSPSHKTLPQKKKSVHLYLVNRSLPILLTSGTSQT